jgi:hypothetical protein
MNKKNKGRNRLHIDSRNKGTLTAEIKGQSANEQKKVGTVCQRRAEIKKSLPTNCRNI